MWARRAIPLLLAALALSGCGSSDLPAPAPASVAPDRGFAARPTPILIHGEGFSVRVVQPSSGGSPTVDETFQAWLGDRPLQEVRRIDGQTLSATVPAGLAPGAKQLRVQGPFGTSGVLPDAFTVEGSALASLTAAISATPATVSVGQAILVTLTVTNGGSSPATTVTPAAPRVTGTGAVGTPAGPDPASIATLAPGASGTFTWSYPTTSAGPLAFSGAASATDSFSGTTVTAATDPAQPAQVTVQAPAALRASLPASGAAALGQEFTVGMTVTNTGGAPARDVVPAPAVVTPPGRATLKAGTGPVPASVASLAAGASATFTWTFVAGGVSGAVTFSSSASGTDANSGTAVTSGAVTSGSFTLGAAGMNATLTPTPATVSVGPPGAITLTLSVTNPGLADVRDFAVGIPAATSTDGAGAALASGPSATPPVVLASGQTFTTAWTFTPSLGTGSSAGHLAFTVALSGTDALSGVTVAAQPSASVTVEAPAGLAATLTATRTPPVPAGQPFTVNVNQLFSLSLLVTNGGGAAANQVTPTPVPGCASPSPASATVPAATPVAFLYPDCASAAPGTLTFTASASGTDANDPARVVTSNTASTAVTVQSPAVVSATGLTTSPASPSAGQGFSVTLALSRTGSAAAAVTAASLSGTTCTNPPTVPVDVIGSTLSLTWSGCTAPATPQTLALEASATWVDANTGVSQTAGPASTTVPVVAAADVTATSIVASPATLSAGQTFSIALTLSKTGGSPANVTGVSMDYASSCLVAPTLPVNDVPATQTLVWTGCTAPAAPQLLSISAFATWVDANLPLVSHPTNSTSTAVVVQAPAALAVAFTSQPASPTPAGAPISLTVNVQNTAPAGGASATGVTVVPTAAGLGGASATCTAASPASASVTAGASVPFTFTCTPSGAGTVTFTATANGIDANGGNGLAASATTSPPTTVLAAASLAVAFASQPVSPAPADVPISLTANVQNTAPAGGASAIGVTVTPTWSGIGSSSATCTTATPASATILAGETVPFTFDCTPSGGPTITFTATATGTDEGNGATTSASATTSPATRIQ